MHNRDLKMCSPNLKRKISNSSYNSNDVEDRRRKYFKFDDLTNRQTQPGAFTRYSKEEYRGHRKLSRSQEEKGRKSKRVRFSDSIHAQEKDSSVKHQQRSSSCEIRNIKPSENGKGNWDLACALAYLHLFGDFVDQNETTDCNSTSSSSPSNSSVDSLNYNQNHDDDSVNFVLYLLTGTSTPAECLSKAESGEHLVVPDVVNPTQAAHHWLSASRRISDSSKS